MAGWSGGTLPLEGGNRLTRAEFERRYAQMPGVKLADNATVRLDLDSEPPPDALLAKARWLRPAGMSQTIRRVISWRQGAEGWAPNRVTEIAAAAFAKRTASSRGWSSARATANAPLKTSPAAVVSAAFTLNPGTRVCRSGVATKAPCAPSVMITVCTPVARSFAAA